MTILYRLVLIVLLASAGCSIYSQPKPEYTIKDKKAIRAYE